MQLVTGIVVEGKQAELEDALAEADHEEGITAEALFAELAQKRG